MKERGCKKRKPKKEKKRGRLRMREIKNEKGRDRQLREED